MVRQGLGVGLSEAANDGKGDIGESAGDMQGQDPSFLIIIEFDATSLCASARIFVRVASVYLPLRSSSINDPPFQLRKETAGRCLTIVPPILNTDVRFVFLWRFFLVFCHE